MIVRTITHQLRLRYPFTISRYTLEVQDTLLVLLERDGIQGHGEATANPYYKSTIPKMIQSIRSVEKIIDKNAGVHPEQMWMLVAPLLQDDYFALCALDEAYWDWYARKQGKTMRSYWSTGSEPLPLTSYTLGIDTLPKMVQKMQDTPWPIYKIKLGTSDDLELVKSLHSKTKSAFRVDANGAWKPQQVIPSSEILAGYGVEFIEQPIAADEALRKQSEVKIGSKLPLLADESCQREEDVKTCVRFFHGINIKLTKCGGITPALRMICKARELGLLVMGGCMTESTVGISALTQLAPLLDFLDADGPLLITNDPAKGVRFDYGNIIFPSEMGSGASI